MRTPSLNLLRYPRRLSGPVSILVVWALAGLLLGVLMGAARGSWSQAQLSDGQRQRQQLLTQREQQSRAAAQVSARLQLIQGQQQAQARHAQWQSRRGQVLRLHALLEQAGIDAGLRLQRWQGDEQRIQLQVWLPQGQVWAAWQSRLTQAGPEAWRLQSLQTLAGGGVQLVLEAPWNPATPPSEGSRP